MKKYFALFILLLFSIPIQSKTQISEKEVSSFMKEKFNIKDYGQFDLGSIQFENEFSVESIVTPKREEFDPDSIEISHSNENFDFLTTHEKSEKRKNIMNNEIKEFIQNIPILRKENVKLIQTTISGKERLLIHFKNPEKKALSIKKKSIESQNEETTTTAEQISSLEDIIKQFNKIQTTSNITHKKNLYIPVSAIQ